MNHLSALEIEEVAAGRAQPAAEQHARECAECAAKASRATTENAAAKAMPRFAAGRARLAQSGSKRRLWFIPAGAIAALALALTLKPGLRIHARGGPSLSIDDLHPRVGETIELRASPAAHSYLLLAAIEPGAAPQVLWNGKPRGVIAVKLTVTRGNTRVVGVFADHMLEEEDAATPPADAEVRSLDVEPRE